MNELDSIVRASLEERVQSPPRMTETADRAIKGARKMRRRQVALAVSGGAVALVVVAGGLAAFRDALPGRGLGPPASEPVGAPTSPTPPGPRPDLLLGQVSSEPGWSSLLTAGGRAVSLSDVNGSVDAAYSVTEGWLVEAVTTANGRALWLVTSTGSATRLLDKLDGLAIAPDGHKIAWRSGDRIRVGRLSGTTLSTDGSTPAPQRGWPIAYTGTDVVLGYSATGGGIDHFDTWAPGRGNYVASWDKTTHVIAVYPPAADGSLLGLVHISGGGKDLCLATLNPAAELHPTRTACGLPLVIDPPGLVSPDGRWLAAPSLNASSRQEVALVDLSTVFDQPKVTATWDADRPVAWLDPTSLALVKEPGTAMVGHTGQPGLTPLSVPAAGAGMLKLPVRRLG
jgi:hypothetical protein